MNIVSSNINSRVHHCSLGLYHLPLKAYRRYQNPSKEPQLIPVCVFVTCEFEVLQAVESKDVFRPACLTDIPFRLYFQFYYLPGYYQALLVTGMILLTVIEVVRIYLGYIGNLKERVIQTNIVSEAERRDPVPWTTQQRMWLLQYSAWACKQSALGYNCILNLGVSCCALIHIQLKCVMPDCSIFASLPFAYPNCLFPVIRCQSWQPSGSCLLCSSCRCCCSSWPMKELSSCHWREPSTPSTSSSCSPRSWPPSWRSGPWPESSPCFFICGSLARWTARTTQGWSLFTGRPTTAVCCLYHPSMKCTIKLKKKIYIYICLNKLLPTLDGCYWFFLKRWRTSL